jgi:hypothetical protein
MIMYILTLVGRAIIAAGGGADQRFPKTEPKISSVDIELKAADNCKPNPVRQALREPQFPPWAGYDRTEADLSGRF